MRFYLDNIWIFFTITKLTALRSAVSFLILTIEKLTAQRSAISFAIVKHYQETNGTT